MTDSYIYLLKPVFKLGPIDQQSVTLTTRTLGVINISNLIFPYSYDFSLLLPQKANINRFLVKLSGISLYIRSEIQSDRGLPATTKM